MERIERNGDPAARRSKNPETVFIFDMTGAVHEVFCDRAEGASGPRQSVPEPELTSKVIRTWLAGLAIALFGLAGLAEPASAQERTAVSAVVETL